MFRKYLLPVLALAGFVFAIYTVRAGSKPLPVAQPVSQPSQAPYESYVAGAGLVEASTENIAIGTIVPGVVTDMYVKVGDAVKKGAPLFKVDDRDQQAELVVRQAAVKASEAKLAKLRRSPRAEEIPPVEARVAAARARFEETNKLWEMWKNSRENGSISPEELLRRENAKNVTDAEFKQAEAELTLLKAGTWTPDIAVAEADVESARAMVSQTQTELDRRTVRAPVDGTLLQVKVRVGEFAQTGPLSTPLMLMGGVQTLSVRIDVDENDAWRLKPGSAATAFVRGNRDLHTDLNFVRIEPYVIPKRSLTGESTERVDTRVLQVLYSFPAGKLPVYVGQQMDVFIEAPGITSAAPTTAPLVTSN